MSRDSFIPHIVWADALVQGMHLLSVEQTLAAGAQLARAIMSSVTNGVSGQAKELCIYLLGDLGAGKTSFCQGFIAATGVHGRVKSPTFTLLDTYQCKAGQIAHFDCYRFSSPEEWLDAGFDDVLAASWVNLIEWPQKAWPYLPTPDFSVELLVQDDARVLRLQTPTPRGQALVTELIARC